ncbi:hypothetical protein ONZ45_g3712 [Pleurotus djamor]|nr:hypothetical protein ONZ45_g3712 [Pleurotus djamor]
MGHRHQVYLIAKVIPHGSTDDRALYRSMGGFHDQWCYGRLAVRASRRFVDLVNQPQNAALIQFEIDAIQKKYSFGSGTEPLFPQIPCPYLMYVLAMSWSFEINEVEGLGGPFLSGNSIESNLIGSDQGSWSQQNDGGITVIDVSDLSNLAYCHVVQDSGIRVVSAEQYLKIYYPDPSNLDEYDKADLPEVTNRMEDVRLLSQDILSQVWPLEYLKSQPTPARAVKGFNKRLSSHISKLLGVAIDIKRDTLLDKEDIQPIFDAFGRKRITNAQFSRMKLAANRFPNTEGLDKMLGQAGKASGASANNKFTIPKPSPLTKPLNPHAEVLDLSRSVLHSTELTSLLANCTKLKSVDLSNTNATIDTVRTVLTANPTISYLNLFGTLISDEDVLGLLASHPKCFYHMDVLLHPIFLSFHNHKRLPYDAAFWFPSPVTLWMGKGGAYPTLPFFTPQRIVQAFTDYLMPFKTLSIDYWQRHLGLFASACMSYGPRPEGTKWGERYISMIPGDHPRFSLQGTYVLAIMVEDPRNSYAFLRMLIEDGMPTLDPAFRMGVKDFIDFLVKEGRPAPTNASVNSLIKLIKRTRLKRMDADEAQRFGVSVTTNLSIFEGEYQENM